MARHVPHLKRHDKPATSESAIVYSASHASGILLALLGMAFQWAFLHSVTFLGSVHIPQGATATNGGGWIINSVCTFLVFAALFALAPRLSPLVHRRPLVAGCAGCLGAGILVLLGGNALAPSPLFTYGGNILIALGSSPLIIMWGELYQYLNPQREQLLVTMGAAVLAVALYLVELLLPPFLFVIAFALFPFGSMGCLVKARDLLEQSADTWRARSGSGRTRSPLLLFICIAIFSIPYNYLINTGNLQSLISNTAVWPHVLAVAIFALSVIGVAEHLSERRGVVLIPGLVLLLLSAACLAHLLAPEAYASATPCLLYAGYYLFLAMVYLSIGPIAATTERNATKLFAEAMLFNVGGLLLGAAIAEAEQLLWVDNATLTVLAIAYVILIAGMVLLGNRSYSLFRINSFDEEEYSFEYVVPQFTAYISSDSGAHDAPRPSAASGSPSMLDAIVEQCAAVGDHFRLSVREREVLIELVRGRTIASIAEELTVSENTIKAHTKGIYRKLEVHTREELLGRVEETGRRP